MGKYLIGGRAGSGKTAVAEALSRRGFNAYDGDRVPGLAHWEDTATGQPATLADYTNVDISRYKWLWDKGRLSHLLATKDTVILCGSADNDLDFASYFDHIFVLHTLPEVQAERLRTRTTNDYGRSEAMIPKIVAEQQDFTRRALALGATAIDANGTVTHTVSTILSYISNNLIGR